MTQEKIRKGNKETNSLRQVAKMLQPKRIEPCE